MEPTTTIQNRDDAGQVHLHFHLIPRHEDDGLALPWYSGKGNHRS